MVTLGSPLTCTCILDLDMILRAKFLVAALASLKGLLVVFPA